MNYILEKNNNMSALDERTMPEAWTEKTLKALATITSGGTPNTKNPKYWDQGDVPWLSSGEVADVRISSSRKCISKLGLKESSAKLIPPGAVLIALAGQGKTRGQVGITDIELSTNQSVAAVVPKQDLNSNFLYYNLRNRYDELRLISGGESGRGGLNLGIISKLLVVCPPLPEQTAIANILSEQESLVAHYDTLIGLHEKRFAYLSDELLSGRLRLEDDGEGGVRVVKNEDWEEVEVNGKIVDVPKEWAVNKLAHLFECFDSKRKPLNSQERSNKKGLYPYWGANSIIDYVDDYLIDEAVVLLGEDAAPFFDKSKKVAFFSNTKIWPNNHVHVLKAINLTPLFGVAVLNRLPYENILGVALRPKLTQATMLNIDITYPPLLEQTHIANILSEQEDIIVNYKNIRDAEQKRFEWLSNALLSGEYRVKIGG